MSRKKRTSAEFEQTSLDTRKDLDREISRLTGTTVDRVLEMIETCAEAPADVTNRHQAYGIAAEHYSKIAAAVKKIKNDADTLLGTLPDPNFPALEAASSLCNSTFDAAAVTLKAAAEMRRTLNNLYSAEHHSSSTNNAPLEDLADGAMFQEAEPAEAEDGTGTDEMEV